MRVDTPITNPEANRHMNKIYPAWTVGFAKEHNATPETFVPATVPGAVQLDWARANGWVPYWYADNYKDYMWMEDVFWTYQTTLDFSEMPVDHEAWFSCKGIDYTWEIYVNDNVLEKREGMFSPILINLTEVGAKHGDVLKVHIHPIPKQHRNGIDRWQADRTCKPPCAYSWDWHPRLVPSGIWDDTVIEFYRHSRFTQADVDYTLDRHRHTAHVTATVELTEINGVILKTEVIAPDGERIAEHSIAPEEEVIAFKFDLKDIKLWWPYDHGAQPLYTLQFTLTHTDGSILDKHTQRVGLRTIRLVMNPEEWDRPEAFPKSRSNPPITIEIYGRSIFTKGTNWVPPEIFPGKITRATYLPLLDYAKESNFNIIRCWGGGIVNKESFYNLCDEMGLMVWSEFTLACLPYEDDPHYLQILEQESEAIISRVKQHTSNILWCGGNELFNSWSGMTDQSKALRLLNAQCYDLDPDTPFLPTSPVAGMGHGHYVFCDIEGK